MAIALATLVLGSCDKPDDASAPGPVSLGEAHALDDAAQMLDARQPPRDQSPTDRASGTNATNPP